MTNGEVTRPLIMEECNYSAELEPRLRHRSAEGRRRSAGSCHVRVDTLRSGSGECFRGISSTSYPTSFVYILGLQKLASGIIGRI